MIILPHFGMGQSCGNPRAGREKSSQPGSLLGVDLSRVLFYDEERFPGTAIGALAKAMVRAGCKRANWKNAWITFR
jgi:hypothetical protein